MGCDWVVLLIVGIELLRVVGMTLLDVMEFVARPFMFKDAL